MLGASEQNLDSVWTIEVYHQASAKVKKSIEGTKLAHGHRDVAWVLLIVLSLAKAKPCGPSHQRQNKPLQGAWKGAVL